MVEQPLSRADLGVMEPQAKPGSLMWVLTDPLAQVTFATARLEPTRELRALGWDVTLICAGEPELTELRGVPLTAVSMPDTYLVRQLIYHWRVIQHILPRWQTLDVVMFYQMSALWLLPLKLLRLLRGGKGPRFVMDVRDLNSADGNWKTTLRAAYYQAMHWLANRFADGQTTITKRMAQLVGVPPKKLLGVWASGVNLEHFAQSRHIRQWPSAAEPVRLVYIGRIHHERCLQPLCEAVLAANRAGLNFVLSLVGGGPAEADLQKLADQSGGGIQMIASVDHAEIPRLLGEAHVGVTSLPPVANEKFQASSPIKLFEYLAAGLPILATRNVCHTDVTDGEPFMFWAADATCEDLLDGLKDAWARRAQLQELGALAEAYSQQHTWRASAQRIGNALRAGLDQAN